MPLNSSNYGLFYNSPYAPTTTQTPTPLSGKSGVNWGGIAGSIAANINPIAMIGQGLLGGIGSYLSGQDENEIREKELRYRQKQDKQQQENFKRTTGISSIQFMKDDYLRALSRASGGM